MRCGSWVLVVAFWLAACGGRSVGIGDESPAASAGGSSSTDSGGSTSTGGEQLSSGGSDSAGGAPGASGSGGEGSQGSGGAVDLPLRPCDSSEGTGCEEDELCIDDGTDSCYPDRSGGCEGMCASKRESSACVGGPFACNGSVTCPILPANCPEGQVHSIVDDCYGPCVPADCCTCDSDTECWPSQLTCDREARRCFSLEAPEPRCRQPFDPGTCDNIRRVFAFIDKSCQEQTSSNCGQAVAGNQFDTLEECLLRCEGLPDEGSCPDGRIARRTCLACGAGGGCSQEALVCAQPCEESEQCDDPHLSCLDGFCGVNFCL